MSVKTKGIYYSKKAENLAGNGEVNKLLNKIGGFGKERIFEGDRFFLFVFKGFYMKFIESRNRNMHFLKVLSFAMSFKIQRL